MVQRESVLVARGTKTEIRPGVWRLHAIAGYDGATGNPRQLSRTVTGGTQVVERELARFVAEVEAGEVLMGTDQTAGCVPGRLVGLRRAAPVSDDDPGVPGQGPPLEGRPRDEEGIQADRPGPRPDVLPLARRRCGTPDRPALSPGPGHCAEASSTVGSANPLRDRPGPAAGIDPTPGAGLGPGQMGSTGPGPQGREPVTAMAVLLAGVTGARRGELCGLRWSDIDEASRQLTIARSIRHGLDKQELVVAPTKTGRARRISLDARALDVLVRYREQAESWAVAARVAMAPDGYILTLDPSGVTPIKPDTITSGFARAAKHVGVRLRFHDLRHMSASLLIGAGTDVRTVAGRLGHADASTTLRIYAHAFEARDRQAAEVLGALLPGQAGNK